MQFREIWFGSPDYQAARSLREAVLRRPLGLPLTQSDTENDGAQLHFGVFDANGELIACVTAAPVSGVEAKIRQTAVASRHRNSGVGTRMMRELESALYAKGFRQLSMHARRDAVAFYQKLGYSANGEEFIEVTIPHLRMTRTLDQLNDYQR